MEKDYLVYKYTSPSGGVYIGQTHNSIEYRAGRDGYQYKVLNKETGEVGITLKRKSYHQDLLLMRRTNLKLNL